MEGEKKKNIQQPGRKVWEERLGGGEKEKKREQKNRDGRKGR